MFFAALEILLNFVPYTPSFFKPNSAQVHKTCDFNVTYKINNYGFRDKDFNFKRENIKKGLYITSNPFCCFEFVAKIYILHHPTTIRENYQSTIHCGSVIQAAKITEILNIKRNVECDKKLLRTGDQAKVKFKFLFKPEFIENETMFIFRENNAKGVGKILNIISD